MILTDLNAPGGIGANCLLLQFDGLNIVVDVGIHPKITGPTALPRIDRLKDIRLDLIFLTHSHLDHLGALPVLARDHPSTPIIMSHDTGQFYRRMLQNSCTVMERQRMELGITGYPLYSYRDIAICHRQVIGLNPGQPRHFEGISGDRISFTLHRAGHIPGAVGIMFEYRHRKILHTGDVLFSDTLLLDGAKFPGETIDTVILETTRGATARRASRASEMERLLESIEETTSRGGSILIPTFALGRMQELITVLHTARKEGRLRNLPVFVSGLGIDLLNQFDRISRGNSSLRIRRKMMRELGAIKLPGTHRPGRERPSIYLLSSGMMVENTPSYNAASALLSSPRNTIAFVGYCDPETPGGRLLATPHGEAFLFKSLGKSVQVLARIGKFDLSSHADREELLDFAQSRDPRRVVLTHGDPEARAWFQEHLGSGSGDDRVINPFPLQAVKV